MTFSAYFTFCLFKKYFTNLISICFLFKNHIFYLIYFLSALNKVFFQFLLFLPVLNFVHSKITFSSKFKFMSLLENCFFSEFNLSSGIFSTIFSHFLLIFPFYIELKRQKKYYPKNIFPFLLKFSLFQSKIFPFPIFQPREFLINCQKK